MSSSFGVVGNPFINQYLDLNHKKIPEDDVITINFDEKYNTLVSGGNLPPVYQASNEVRDSSNMYYINAMSNCVPDELSKKVFYNSLDSSTEYFMPLDYLLFTRSDGTNFLLAENISDRNNFKNLKSYSLLRFSHYSGSFYDTTLYSDGIDISRIRDNDHEYVDVVADRLLSEKRINESLLSVDAASRYKGSDEITHASGYVGYIDAKSLEIGSTLDGNLPRLLEQDVKEKGITLRDDAPIDSLFRAIRTVAYRFKQLFKSKDSSWKGVIDKGTIIPDMVLEGILKDAPIEEKVKLDKMENAEKIELEPEIKPEIELEIQQEIQQEIEQENNIENNKENEIEKNEIAEAEERIEDDREKAAEGAVSFRNLANTLNAIQQGKVKPEPKSKDDDEIGNN